ncbi:CocE/NonD family hydrolase [Sphingobium sp.]|uniref:CocE/NonD family hydrolase n=1 Tax=Sphingobium sp. TaxID=1912891 RepID=UPI0028BEBE1B|nr:CocE/NonD family hydrolase [Sphingobium sp.]
MHSDQAAMIVARNVPVPVRDGAILYGNLYRPCGDARHPVIVSCTPYGKDVHVSKAMPPVWGTVQERYPEILAASSCAHMIWECPDPESWVNQGYAVLQVDVRGTGKSPGFMQPNSPIEALDGYDVIQWAVEQPWCDGSAAMLGLGYITCTNWRVAALRPPGLKAAVFCQGTPEFYRDRARNDGIYNSGFNSLWWNMHGLPNQHGNGDSPFPDMYTGDVATGIDSFPPEKLAANRVDYPASLLDHPLLDDWFAERLAGLSSIGIPSLVIANWGGLGLQLRGTIGGWTRLGSARKWLKVEGGSYFFTFFTPERVAYLKQFFDHHLKGRDNGWVERPRVELSVRSTDDGIARDLTGADWPLPDIEWQRLHFDLAERSLTAAAPGAAAVASYAPGENEITLLGEPLAEPMIIAGPLSARLHLACETEDTDLFLTVRIVRPDGTEVSFFSATDPWAAPTQGWLRASQRKLDPGRTTEYLPCHQHDERQPLTPGEIYEVEVSIWPAGIEIPAGCRLGLTIAGADFVWPASAGKGAATVPMTHDDPCDRPAAIFGGGVTLHSGPAHPSWLALPLWRKRQGTQQ